MVSIKLECWSESTAKELVAFIKECGWRAKPVGKAVLSDMPGQYAGCYCNAMIKIVVPTQDDLREELGV